MTFHDTEEPRTRWVSGVGRSRSTEKRRTKDSKPPFETKAAKDDLPRYGGAKDKVGLWRRKFRY